MPILNDEVYISIKGQANVDLEPETKAFQAIEGWLRQNILDGGNSIGLLDLEALGDKRDRPTGGGETEGG